MSRSRRYLVNALILLLIGAHAVYRFFNERTDLVVDGIRLERPRTMWSLPGTS